jgi:NAD(P)-dependent dehydrogenase (short-subunit alcohol dehydrogenase family)
MKVAITGHTKGIGQGLYNYFQTRGHNVCGFSRSNGFALPAAEFQILDAIKDCDIFVNNALPVSSQLFLLKKLWPLWAQQDKKIIVIGSVLSHIPVDSIISQVPDGWAEHGLEQTQYYRQVKKELDDLCKALRYESTAVRCSLISIHPGYVATNIFAEVGAQHPPIDQCLSVDQVVDLVDYALSSTIKIDDIVFRR